MYKQYFGLTELPFSIAPDPRYLYMSERHREALAHLLYGLQSDGAFILLSGDVGTGKTTMSRCLLEQIPPNTDLALVLNPRLSVIELLETICDELHISYSATTNSVKTYVDLINHHLLDAHARGRNTVVLIEEAQNLDRDVLEQLRLLTNLETNERKLLQIILLGQPELLEILDRADLSQLSQRITARYHLSPLNKQEMMAYVSHRLAVAGCERPLFGRSVLNRLYRLSQGIPRRINLLCDRALLGAYVQNRSQPDSRILDTGAREVLGDKAFAAQKAVNWSSWIKPALAMAVLLVIGLVFYLPLNVGNKEVSDSLVVGPMEQGIIEPASVTEQTAQAIDDIPWPDESKRLRSNQLAFHSLFQRWGMAYQAEQSGSPCFYAQTQGLACLHGKDTLSNLRKYNRPVILTLYDAKQQPYFALLSGLGNKTAEIDLAGEKINLSVPSLTYYWHGEFSLFWRQPPGYQEMIRPGHNGDEVQWLSQKMNQIEGRPRVNEGRVYKQELVEKVRRFQQSQGLLADGIVGIQTLMRINHETGQDAPLLWGDKG